jgi:hypothetical protein
MGHSHTQNAAATGSDTRGHLTAGGKVQASAPASPRDRSLDPATDADAIGRETERIAREAADEAHKMGEEARKDAEKAMTDDLPAPMTEKAKDPDAGDTPDQEYLKGHAKKPAALEPEPDVKDGDEKAAEGRATLNCDDALSKARFAAKDAGHVHLPEKENAVQKIGSYIGSWLNFAKGTTTGTFHIIQSGVTSATQAAFGPKQAKPASASDKKEEGDAGSAGGAAKEATDKSAAPSETALQRAKHMSSGVMEKSTQLLATAWGSAKKAPARALAKTQVVTFTAWSKTRDVTVAGWNKTQDTAMAAWNKTRDTTMVGWNKTRDTTMAGWNNARDTTMAGLNKARDTTITGWNKTRDTTTAGWNKARDTTMAGWNTARDTTIAGWNKTRDTTVTAWNKTLNATVAGWNKTKDAVLLRGKQPEQEDDEDENAQPEDEAQPTDEAQMKDEAQTIVVALVPADQVAPSAASPLVAEIPQDATPPLDTPEASPNAMGKGIAPLRQEALGGNGQLQAASG